MEIDPKIKSALVPFLFSLADDELIMGHRDSEWCAFAPMIEEDVAFASIAQDEMGHARLYLQLLEGLGEGSLNDLAFMRAPQAYRSALFVEHPNGDWAYTVARHLAYDLYDDVMTEVLQSSDWEPLRDVARLIRREEIYHLEHQKTWVAHLAQGTDVSRSRLLSVLPQVAGEIGGLFEEAPWMPEIVATRILPESQSALFALFEGRLRKLYHSVDIEFPPISRQGGLGGRMGEHTDDFLECHRTMTEVISLDPTASW